LFWKYEKQNSRIKCSSAPLPIGSIAPVRAVSSDVPIRGESEQQNKHPHQKRERVVPFLLIVLYHAKQNSRIKREWNKQAPPLPPSRTVYSDSSDYGETEQQNKFQRVTNTHTIREEWNGSGLGFILLGFFWTEQIQQNKLPPIVSNGGGWF